MPRREKARGRHRLFLEFQEARSEPLLEAMAAACAMIAYADGWVTPEEQWRMLGLIHRFEPLKAVGIEEVILQFDKMTEAFTEDHDEGEHLALAIIAKLRGNRKHAEILAVSCCVIAEADGAFDAEERLAARRICLTLGLDPKQFDLGDLGE